jgi:sugar phosphate isomerase/epimerase
MLIPGLVSISFRKSQVHEVIDLVIKSELSSVEWGGDVHIPPGAFSLAREVNRTCTESGIKVSAYGSYYRVGTDPDSFEIILDTAVHLGAGTVRVWAGNIASADITSLDRALIVDDLARCCDLAQSRAIRICTEFHNGTLTDTPDSWLKLNNELNRPNLYTFWQPPTGMLPQETAAGLSELLPHVSNIHVFHWWPTHIQRLPLAAGAEQWQQYLQLASSDGQNRYLSLEFVKDDRVDQFLADARMLRLWLSQIEAD